MFIQEIRENYGSMMVGGAMRHYIRIVKKIASTKQQLTFNLRAPGVYKSIIARGVASFTKHFL